MTDDTVILRLPRRDAPRVLAAVGERRRKLEKGMNKFAENFDPVLGANMKASFEAYSALEEDLKEAINDNSHRAGRNPSEHEERNQRPRYYRAKRQQS